MKTAASSRSMVFHQRLHNIEEFPQWNRGFQFLRCSRSSHQNPGSTSTCRFFVRRSDVSSWKGALRVLHLIFSHLLFPIDFLFRLRFLEFALPCSFRCALHFLFRQSPRPLFMVLGCSVNGHQRIFDIVVKIYCGWFVLLRPSDWAHVILGAMHAM